MWTWIGVLTELPCFYLILLLLLILLVTAAFLVLTRYENQYLRDRVRFLISQVERVRDNRIYSDFLAKKDEGKLKNGKPGIVVNLEDE
jgi:hypothetical protein